MGVPWLVCVLAGLFILGACFGGAVGSSSESNEGVVVQRVIDGDTLLLETGERIRLIGVDTPETKHPKKPVQFFGREASAFTKKMVEGRRVWLSFDVERRDKYGRSLAYVFDEQGRFLNAEIIRQGYGFAYTRFPFKHLELFRALEREAREQSRGLWAGSSVSEAQNVGPSLAKRTVAPLLAGAPR